MPFPFKKVLAVIRSGAIISPYINIEIVQLVFGSMSIPVYNIMFKLLCKLCNALIVLVVDVSRDSMRTLKNKAIVFQTIKVYFRLGFVMPPKIYKNEFPEDGNV